LGKKKPSTKFPAQENQRALVIGVSQYPDPANHLPAVAADVREMAKALSSKHGSFPSAGVTVLIDKQATCNKVVSALRHVFTDAVADETIFVYLAGHGAVVGTDYFFIAHDTDGNRLDGTGVSLKRIKMLFDQTKSRRVFLWLDFCHAGGILARGTTNSDMSDIRRAIGVVSGQGKIIVAACTPIQSTYEDAAIGHGLFLFRQPEKQRHVRGHLGQRDG
jgi:helicase